MKSIALIYTLFSVVLGPEGVPVKEYRAPFLASTYPTIEACKKEGEETLLKGDILLMRTDKNGNMVFKTFQVDAYKCVEVK